MMYLLPLSVPAPYLIHRDVSGGSGGGRCVYLAGLAGGAEAACGVLLAAGAGAGDFVGDFAGGSGSLAGSSVAPCQDFNTFAGWCKVGRKSTTRGAVTGFPASSGRGRAAQAGEAS